jgi:hypothetical protein
VRLGLLSSFLLSAPCAISAQQLEIRTAPSARVYLHEVNRGAGVVDFVVQNVAIVNRGAQRLTLQSVRYEVLRRDQVILAQYFPRDMLESIWRFLRGYLDRPGTMTSQASTFLFDSVLTGGVVLAQTTALEANAAVMLPRRPFVTSMVVPERLRISATAVNDAGAEINTSIELALVRHTSPNEYRCPMEGRWYVASGASLQSHHRWRPASEFALDLTQIDAGSRSFRGDGTRASDYFAYGHDVLAVAPGRVVAATADVPDNELPKPNESRADFARRVLTPLWERDSTGNTANGNIVVIEHAGSEYSSYAHLKPGSVRVRVGDSVSAGQPIAQVGFSGDGFEPHVHFQITRGPDPHYSRGLPVSFVNIRPIGFSSTIDQEPRRSLLTGEFVETVRR